MLNETKLLLWRTSAVCLGLALPSLVLGRGIMFALLALGLLSGAMATRHTSLRASVQILRDSPIVRVAGVTLLVLLASALLSIDTGQSIGRWLQLLATAASAAGLFLVLREMPGGMLEVLLKYLAIGTLVMAGLGLVDALVDEPRVAVLLHGLDRSEMPDRLNYLSAALAILLPFVWARLMIKARELEPFARRMAVPLIAVSLAAALVCGGIGGWLGLAASAGAFVALVGRWHGIVFHRRHWLVLGVTLVLTLLAYGVAQQRLPGGRAVLQEVQALPVEAGAELARYLPLWNVAVRHAGDQPLVGIGIDAFRSLPEIRPLPDKHPHNWLVQLLVETGVLGLVSVLVLLSLIARRFVQFAPGNVYAVAALASMAGFAASGLFGASIFNLWWVTFIVFAMLLGWRAGWGGPDMGERRRRTLSRRELLPYGQLVDRRKS